MRAHRRQALGQVEPEMARRLLDVVGEQGEGRLDDEVERDVLGLGLRVSPRA